MKVLFTFVVIVVVVFSDTVSPTRRYFAARHSDFLIGISHSAAEDCGEDHLDVFWEGIVVKIVEVEADFVGEDYLVFLGSNRL